MARDVYTPGSQNDPYGNIVANPEASEYGDYSAFSPEETIHLQKAIRSAIFNAAPAQYNALKLLYQKEPQPRNNDEVQYTERTFGRDPIEVDTGTGGQTGAPQTIVSSNPITLTAGSTDNIAVDDIVVFPDNTKGTVTDISGNDIIVSSITGGDIPATNSGDVLAIQSTIYGDGLDYFSHYGRLQTITRHNYIQFFLRARRWTRLEYQKYINSATTDYLETDKIDKLEQLRTDLFVSFFNGDRGEYQLGNGGYAKSMGGIFPTIEAAGAQSANPTLAGLQAAIESLTFSTNYKAEGETRFLVGTDQILHEVSKIYKEEKVRYEPNSQVANLNLSMIQLGTHNLVLVPAELFKDPSCFPSVWQNRLLCVDMESIQPVRVRGIPPMSMGTTLDRKDGGTRENFKDWWCEAQLGLEINNPLGFYWIDVQ